MVRRIIAIRPAERRRALLLFVYLFLVVSSYVITKATRDALFLERYSAATLPQADIASALGVTIVMAVYIRVGRRVALPVVQIATVLTFASTSLLFFWWLNLSPEPRWMRLALYIWASILGVLLPAQAWTLANYVVTTREAKRTFGLIGSGAICGCIVGGFLTRIIAARLSTETLLVASSITLVGCSLPVAAVWRERRDQTEPTAATKDLSKALRSSLALVWHSRYLRAIAALTWLASLVTTIAAWQFRAIAKAYVPDTEALAAFFGTFNFYTGVLALVVQVFVTAPLLTRFGLGLALLVVPVSLAAGSLTLLVWGTLWAGALLKGSDQVLRYSIDRPAAELLYVPIPAEHTFVAKSFIDTVVWRIGDCSGAVLVLAAAAWLEWSPSQIGVLTLMLAGAWAAAATVARREYITNLRENIHQHRVDAEQMAAAVLDRSASAVLNDALKADEPAHLLYALSLLEERETAVPDDTLRRLLHHRDPRVRRTVIEMFAEARNTAVLPEVEPLLSDEDLGVRTEALLYLTRLTDVDPLERLQRLEDVRDISLHVAMVAHLARNGPHRNLDAARLLLDAAIGANAGSDKSRLEAVRVLGSLSDEALVSLSDVAVPLLAELLGRATTAIDVRREIPDVLLRIGTAAAEQALAENLFEADPLLRLRIVSALNKLRQIHPDRRLERELVETVLAAEILGHFRSYQLWGRLDGRSDRTERLERLQDDMKGELERIFRLLKLLYPEGDLHSAYFGAQSANAAVHDRALEFLEHTLPPRIRDLLLPLIDNDVSMRERTALAERLVSATFNSSTQAMAALTASDALIHEAADRARRRLGDNLDEA